MKRSVDVNPRNKFDKYHMSREHEEGIDLAPDQYEQGTEYIEIFPKTIVNKVTSPDVNMDYSLNPYQGCEHGCAYCYARNSHQFWGYSSGLDFEQKILVKKNTAHILEQTINSKAWEVKPISLSGNTDCYQPIERKLALTRAALEVLARHKHPVGIITKNALVIRDKDILKEMASENLVRVVFSINTLDEELRRKMEPRTSSVKKKLQALEELSKLGIPCGVMMAPIIPGLNSHEILKLAEVTANSGSLSLGYTIVRLNENLSEIFSAWIREAFPDRANKVLKQIKSVHGGKLNDSRFGKRMKGEGRFAEMVKKTMEIARTRHYRDKGLPALRSDLFIKGGQLNLFR
jgi:DNA repair photolyase